MAGSGLSDTCFSEPSGTAQGRRRPAGRCVHPGYPGKTSLIRRKQSTWSRTRHPVRLIILILLLTTTNAPCAFTRTRAMGRRLQSGWSRSGQRRRSKADRMQTGRGVKTSGRSPSAGRHPEDPHLGAASRPRGRTGGGPHRPAIIPRASGTTDRRGLTVAWTPRARARA